MDKLAEKVLEEANEGLVEIMADGTIVDLEPDRPCICDEAVKASQYLYVIGQMEADIAKVEEIAEAQIKTIMNWQKIETRKVQAQIDWLALSLEGWTRAQDKKTVKLPNGELKLRAQQASMEIDEEQFFSVIQNPDLIRTIPAVVKPDKNAIRAFIKNTGEVLTGVSWEEPQEPKFSYVAKVTE